MRKHGDKFKLNDASTWNEATQSIEVNHAKLGRIKVSLWSKLHFRKAATRSMSLIRVERLNEQGILRVSKPLWLAWLGEQMPTLEEVWQLYLRRFTVDHWYRFLKQRLHWTLPKLSTPKQCERWSDLMPIMTWELWLARDIVADNPLPGAKVIRQFDSWKGCPVDGEHFSGCWYSCPSAQTSRKVPRLEARTTATT
jgi:hypothetical protein